VGTYCYAAVCRRGRLGGARRLSAHRGKRGVGHIAAATRLQVVCDVITMILTFHCAHAENCSELMTEADSRY